MFICRGVPISFKGTAKILDQTLSLFLLSYPAAPEEDTVDTNASFISDNDSGIGTGLDYDLSRVWSLQGDNLTGENSLSWTSSFEENGPGTTRFSPCSERQVQIQELCRSFILGSSLKVIILCGIQVQRHILSASRDSLAGPHHLNLRDNSHSTESKLPNSQRLWIST